MKTSALALLLTLPFLSCTDMGIEGRPPQIRELSASEKLLIESNGKFWLKLLKEIDKTDSEENIFISPLSISFALGMTLNGAEGSTYDAMKSTLEFGDMSLDDINKSYRSLMTTLSSADPKVQMEIANSIWNRNTFPVEQQFIQVNQTYFDATVRSLDFSSSSAAPAINKWVSEKTHGKIKEIVASPIPAEMIMYLINALYFKGAWTNEFDKAKTFDGEFTLKDGSKVTCKMMRQENRFSIYGTSRYQAVDLPYSNELFSMTIVLPNDNTSITEFVSLFTENDWLEVVGKLSEQKLHLYMPRVRMEYDLDLIDPLRGLGMGIAFDPGNGNFKKINKNVPLSITEAKHKTFVEINEEGTEAAAVTSVGVGVTSVPPSININRPFIFVIRERNSGAVLFVGKIMNPKEQ